MFKNNIITINKPKNMTSYDVIRVLKKELNIKKIGHGGTLDPLATGVLIIGINKGTKLLGHELTNTKKYLATIEFGIQTSTYDLEGEITNRSEVNVVLEDIISILNNWKNIYMQKPPIYSALKLNGKKLYEYARNNEVLEIKPRETKILDYNILSFQNNILKIEIKVPKGFYVRSLANDLGISLNSFGVLAALVRTQSGDFKLADCHELKDFIDEYKKMQIIENQ